MAESALFGTMNEVTAVIKNLRKGKVDRVETAKRKIKDGHAQIKLIQSNIALYEEDIVWCAESITILNDQLALLEVV